MIKKIVISNVEILSTLNYFIFWQITYIYVEHWEYLFLSFVTNTLY